MKNWKIIEAKGLAFRQSRLRLREGTVSKLQILLSLNWPKACGLKSTQSIGLSLCLLCLSLPLFAQVILTPVYQAEEVFNIDLLFRFSLIDLVE